MVLVIYQEIVTRYYGPPPASTPPAIENKRNSKRNERNAQRLAHRCAPHPWPKSRSRPRPGSRRKMSESKPKTMSRFLRLRGARLKSFTFKNYRSAVDVHSPPYDIVQTAPGVPLPLGVRWQSPAPFDDADVNYSVQGVDVNLKGERQTDPGISRAGPNGAVITKSFTFSGVYLSDSNGSRRHGGRRHGADPGDS